MIKVALIGCGRVAAKSHITSWQKVKGAKVIAVCDSVKENAENIAKLYNIEHIYFSYEKLLQNLNVDIIDIATPSALHVEMALLAASYGRHCIVEKPLALTLQDADSLIDIFKAKNLKLTVVLQNRFNYPIQLLKKELIKGTFGKPLLGNVTVRWTRPQSYYDNTWQGLDGSGGALINQAIHHIDALLWVFNKKVKSVFAYIGTLNHKMHAEDAATILIKFEDNTFASIEASVLAYPHNLEGSITLLCEKGSVKIGGVALNEISFWHTQKKTSIDFRGKPVNPSEVYGESHSLVFKDMVSAIKNNRNPKISGEDGKLALKIIVAAYESAQYGKEIFL